MFYLTKDAIESKHTGNYTHIDYDGIYTTKEEKIAFITITNRNEMFIELLQRLYPEVKKYRNQHSYSAGSIYNSLLFGVSLQYAIAIIENPHIICTGSGVELPYVTLPSDLSLISKINKIEYNGNYVLLIGKAYSKYKILRLLLSKTDLEFIPSHPEFVYGNYFIEYDYRIWDEKNPRFSETMFLNDYDIHTFVNHEHNNIVHYFWIIVNSDKHFKEIDFLCKHYRNIHLIIKIKNFEQYDILLKELSKYSFIVFSNSNDEKYPIDEHELVNFYNETDASIFFDSELNLKNKYLQSGVINYRDFGLIRNLKNRHLSLIEAWEEMRTSKNLPTLEFSESFFNSTEYFKID